MNRNKLKTYAPQARREFIEAVKDRAAHYGLTAKKIEPVTEQGDVVLIAGRPFPKAVGKKRKKLEDRIKRVGFGQMIEAMAYTWFNRLVAIRFMELHGYLEHGYRVLSHPEGHGQPEILDHAQHVDLPGLDSQQVIDLKLEGTNQANENLYRLLLIGQCNALSKAMPFLFESIDDETELLLPDNLLHSDSLIRKLVGEIPEEDWQEVEIIGWLYQFYISEKKDEVIGKVVKSEDIPAATQLFTPNWIVKYLVQNSLGRQWMATYPDSPLKTKMEYYIEPAEQTEEVQAKLAEITPTSLNPEELTLLDPACGSGHILVEAYELLKAIYQERGYRAKDIPRLILEKNLYGLEIDDRAAQLAAFALMMKARADDRSIFERDVQPQVLSIQESKGMDPQAITEALNEPILKEKQPPSGELFEEIADEKSPLFSRKNLSKAGDISQADVAHLIDLFEHGKTFGSLIQIPEKLAEKLPAIAQRVDDVIAHGGMFEQGTAREFRALIEQSQILARLYDAVAANPPYMGMGAMNKTLKVFILEWYKDAKIDIYAAFILRCLELSKENGNASLITMHSWLFVFRFESLRQSLLSNYMLDSLVHLGPHAFPEITGQVVQVATFCFRRTQLPLHRPSFFRLLQGSGDAKEKAFLERRHLYSRFEQNVFLRTPGTTICYWAGRITMKYLTENPLLESVASPRHGMVTSDNDRFVRIWHEVDSSKVGRGYSSRDAAAESGKKWFPYNKGGTPRPWYGNTEYLVNWENDGEEIIAKATDLYGSPSRKIQSPDYYFLSGLTWSSVTMKSIALRANGEGFLFDSGGSSMFFRSETDLKFFLGLLNSSVARHYMRFLSPTINVNAGDLARIPIMENVTQVQKDRIAQFAERAIELMREEYTFSEEHWEFELPGVLSHRATTIAESFHTWVDVCRRNCSQIAELHNAIDHDMAELYGLADEVSDADSNLSEQTWGDSNGDAPGVCEGLISYAIGCMMGRYSLDEPGLIYAHSGNEGFDPAKYKTFPADEDGIVPLTELEWFEDDAALRFVNFITTAWPKEYLEENLKFVAESLGQKKGESPRETIRRYLAADFYKHHLSRYKKRPIYWLFSSGKQRGFQALVYLHRYNEGTLARMRTQYVIPLIGKMTARIDHLTEDIAQSSSSQQSKRLEKEKSLVTKQLAEVQAFEEQLRHYADQRIKLDLDDGVKVNYGKFGDLLADVTKIAGKKAGE